MYGAGFQTPEKSRGSNCAAEVLASLAGLFEDRFDCAKAVQETRSSPIAVVIRAKGNALAACHSDLLRDLKVGLGTGRFLLLQT
jgi:hypothetical protein